MEDPDFARRPAGGPDAPEPPREPHQPNASTPPMHSRGAWAGAHAQAPQPDAPDPVRPPGGVPAPRERTAAEAGISPAKPRSLTPTRLLTTALLIVLAFIGGVLVQKNNDFGYTPPAAAEKEAGPHGH